MDNSDIASHKFPLAVAQMNQVRKRQQRLKITIIVIIIVIGVIPIVYY